MFGDVLFSLIAFPDSGSPEQGGRTPVERTRVVRGSGAAAPMSDLNLTQLRVREDAQPQYPLLRQPSACQEWGHNEMLVLAAQGVASVTLLWRNNLIDTAASTTRSC